MQRKRGLVPIGDAVYGLDDVPAIRNDSPQARHHFTVADQVDQLVSASEADPDLGFMARLLALCSLPRTNPGNRLRYVRRNGPYKLGMTAGIDSKLPFGNFPANSGLGVHGSGTDGPPRDSSRKVALRLHAVLGPGAGRRRSHPPPQPDAAALQRSRQVGL